jgi:hypothetical protein
VDEIVIRAMAKWMDVRPGLVSDLSPGLGSPAGVAWGGVESIASVRTATVPSLARVPADTAATRLPQARLREQLYAPFNVVNRSLMRPFPQAADFVGNVSGARATNESPSRGTGRRASGIGIVIESDTWTI